MKKIAGIYGLIVFVLFLLLPQIGEGANVTVTCPKQKLQTAITKAAADTTILVKGTCNEKVVIDETKINITLNGMEQQQSMVPI